MAALNRSPNFNTHKLQWNIYEIWHSRMQRNDVQIDISSSKSASNKQSWKDRGR